MLVKFRVEESDARVLTARYGSVTAALTELVQTAVSPSVTVKLTPDVQQRITAANVPPHEYVRAMLEST